MSLNENQKNVLRGMVQASPDPIAELQKLSDLSDGEVINKIHSYIVTHKAHWQTQVNSIQSIIAPIQSRLSSAESVLASIEALQADQ